MYTPKPQKTRNTPQNRATSGKKLKTQEDYPNSLEDLTQYETVDPQSCWRPTPTRIVQSMVSTLYTLGLQAPTGGSCGLVGKLMESIIHPERCQSWQTSISLCNFRVAWSCPKPLYKFIHDSFSVSNQPISTTQETTHGEKPHAFHQPSISPSPRIHPG